MLVLYRRLTQMAARSGSDSCFKRLPYADELNELVGVLATHRLLAVAKETSDLQAQQLRARSVCFLGGDSNYCWLVQKIETLPEFKMGVSRCW